MAAVTTRKLKILMAHGYASNSFIFSKRSGAIRKACRDVADFTFINGPLLVQPISSAGNLDALETEQGKPIDENTPIEEQPRAWWRSNDQGKYLDWDKTVDYLNQVLENDGPFDAVWGFSQGGCLAGLLAAGFENPANMPGLQLPPGQGPLRFAIAVSGFRSRDEAHQALFQKPVQTPILHVLGRADHIVDVKRSQTLVDICANSRVELHDGGHALPSQASWRNFFRDFISVFVTEPYVPNDDWRTVEGPSQRPKGETPGASSNVTPSASGTSTPSKTEASTTVADLVPAAAVAAQGEHDIDPANPSRLVPRKKANQPFLVHQRWKEEQERKRRQKLISEGKNPDEHPAEEEVEIDLSLLTGFFSSLFRLATIGVVIAVAAGQFIAGDMLWGYRGKYVKLRTYMPYHEKIFSLPELAMYNGRDPNKPVYISILGDVFDVTAGARIYGPHGSYSFFGGKDASRAYVTGCFKTDITYDVRDFNDQQMKELLGWKSFYENHNDYFKVGRVVLPPLDADTPPPPPCENSVPQKK